MASMSIGAGLAMHNRVSKVNCVELGVLKPIMAGYGAKWPIVHTESLWVYW